MADTGPCGPSSEIFWDLGPDVRRGGRPGHGAEDRYVEIWNLVFMQFDQQPDGTLVPLPAPSVDTGAGLERNLAVLQGADSIWDIDVFRPLIAAAERVTGVALRRLPGHRARRVAAHPGRARPHHDLPRRRRRRAVERGARLRAAPHHPARGAPRVPARRARPRHARRSSTRRSRSWAARTRSSSASTTSSCSAVGSARRSASARRSSVASTSSTSSSREGDVSGQRRVLPARHARLPDRPHPRDRRGARTRCRPRRLRRARWRSSGRARRRRTRPRAARRPRRSSCTASCSTRSARPSSPGAASTRRSGAKVLALVAGGERRAGRRGASRGRRRVDVVLDRTPFYAESGGQVGDTGRSSRARRRRVAVLDTQYGLPGPRRAPVRGACRVDRARATRSSPRSTANAATASAATTPRPTCCTGRCARCSART